MTSLFLRDPQQTQHWAEAAISLSSIHGFIQEGAWSMMLRGWALALQGTTEEGIAQIPAGLTQFRATGARLDQPFFLSLLAEAYAYAGQMEQSVATVNEALEWVARTGERLVEARLYLLKGEIVLNSAIGDRLSREAQAEELFYTATTIANRQSAKVFELRVIVSLARLWHQQAMEQGVRSREQRTKPLESEKARRPGGQNCVPASQRSSRKLKEQESHPTQDATRTKLAEAHHMLSDIYNWFTEGFDTIDLKEAKALIAELEDVPQRNIE